MANKAKDSENSGPQPDKKKIAKTPKTSSKKTAAKKKAPAKKAAIKKAPAKKKAEVKKEPEKKDFDGDTSIRHLAKLLGYADGTIRKHIENNGGPVTSKSVGGKAATVNVKDWHEFLIARALGDGNPLGDLKLQSQQEELRRKKRENDLAEGQAMSIELVNFFFNEIVVILGNKLDGISGKSASGNPALRQRFLDEIKQAKHETFSAISKFLQDHCPDGEEIHSSAD